MKSLGNLYSHFCAYREVIRAVFPLHIMAGVENKSKCLAVISYRKNPSCGIRGSACPRPQPGHPKLRRLVSQAHLGLVHWLRRSTYRTPNPSKFLHKHNSINIVYHFFSCLLRVRKATSQLDLRNLHAVGEHRLVFKL